MAFFVGVHWFELNGVYYYTIQLNDKIRTVRIFLID